MGILTNDGVGLCGEGVGHTQSSALALKVPFNQQSPVAVTGTCIANISGPTLAVPGVPALLDPVVAIVTVVGVARITMPKE